MQRILIYYREDNERAQTWHEQLSIKILEILPDAQIVSDKPELVIVLGGDGTILEAARKYATTYSQPLILGLNLGHVGFLASVRDESRFIEGVTQVLQGKFRTVERMMIKADVQRDGKSVFRATSLNEFSVQNLLSVVEIDIFVEEHQIQSIRGNGVLVATATGSTAYNLSAHGPIVMPDIQCMIVSELLDHSTPTPSIVISPDRTVTLHIRHFRPRGVVTFTQTGAPVDVMLSADGSESFCVLEVGDKVIISKSPQRVLFAELESDYFFRSLHEKFSFK